MPRDDASALEWLLFEQAGVLTWRQASAELTPAAIRHLLVTERWRRICRGVLVSRPGPLTREQQWWIAVLATGENALLAGLAAARAGGLRGSWQQELVDVLVPYGRGVPALRTRLPVDMPAVRVRRSRQLASVDQQCGRPTRTTMARSLVDAAQWARTDDEAQVVLAAGCQQRLAAPPELRGVVGRMPKVRRRTLILTTILDIEGGAEALSEIDFVRLCRRHRLPLPELQERRRDGSGRVRYIDAYWRDWRLHGEVDGGHHMEARHWAADLRRQNEIWITDDRILRFTAFDVRRRHTEVADRLRAALIAAGWRG